MKYIVVGPTIVNDIIFTDNTQVKQVLGGSIYCVAGIKIWEDDCLYISNVGNDFDSFYGEYMKSNDISYKGLNYILPHTWYTTLKYEKNGLHSETLIYGEKEEELLNEIDVVTSSMIANHCSDNTKGIYIEASETSEIFKNIKIVKDKTKAKIMWEIPTSASLDPSRKNDVLNVIKLVDIYSINVNEGLRLFNVTSESETIEKIIELNVPCFLRAGEKGSYMIVDKKAHFYASLNIPKVIDPTGCGNVSTAAALYGYCEGLHPEVIAKLANISASFNLNQFGPIPNTKEVRDLAKALLNSELK